MIRQHPFAHKAGERSQNVARQLRPARREAQSRQRNHSVAPPVAEPGISGQDRFRIRQAIERARHYELVRCKCKLLDRLGKWQVRSRICRGEARKERTLFNLALRVCNFAIEKWLLRRAGNNGERSSRCNSCPKFTREKMIGAIWKATPSFGSEVKIAVPILGGACLRRVAQYIKRDRTIKGNYLQSSLDWRDLHRRSLVKSHAVLIGVIRQHFDRQFDRGTCADQPVQHVRGVRSRLHEDSLFEQRVGQRECPNGSRSL